MATAAQRFFAIPELLEQVLLELGGYADPLENPSNIIDLFALHRVNRSFAATIRDSQKLRWRMGLRDQLPRAQYHGSIENIALTCLRRGIFIMPPYEFMHTTRPYPSPSRPKHLLLAFQVSADYFAEEYLGSLGYFGGLRGKSGRIYCKPRQSWRQMRLTTDPIPIVVQINVYCPHKELRGSPLSGPFCTEWVSFRPSEVTLGNLADFFEAVGRKKREGHEQGLVRFDGVCWGNVGKKQRLCLSCSWRKVVLVWLACGFLWELYVAAKLLWTFLKANPGVLLWVSGAIASGWACLKILEKETEQGDQADVKEVQIFN